MNFTNKASIGYKIAEAIFEHGPKTVDELSDLLPGAEHRIVKRQIGRMCFELDLESVGGLINLRPNVRRHFERHAPKAVVPVQIAGPREFFAVRPLSAKHIPSTQGRRPGADDFRNWGSRHV